MGVSFWEAYIDMNDESIEMLMLESLLVWSELKVYQKAILKSYLDDAISTAIALEKVR